MSIRTSPPVLARCLALGLFVALAPAALSAPRQAVAELKQELLQKLDDADDALITKLADEATRPAMEALLEVYEKVSSTWMRREVVVALGRFDRVEEAFQPALEKIMNVATEAEEPELRDAALVALGKATQHGKAFLALIVESPADDDIRIEAMRLHIRLAEPADDVWYRVLYEREKKSGNDEQRREKPKRPKKGEEVAKELAIPRLAEVRRLAMQALLSSLKDEDLINDFKEDSRSTVGRLALAELHKRGNSSAETFARDVLSRVDYPAETRADAAAILATIDGPKIADEFIDLAKKRDVTQQVLRDRMADLLAAMKDPGVDKKTLALVGKGDPHEKGFALRATRFVDDPKLVEKIRKGLKDKDNAVLRATLASIATRKDREAIPDLEKMFDKSKDVELNESLLETLSALHDGNNDWVERLKGFAGSEELTIRNAAVYELGRLGRRNLLDFFVSKFADPNWSTRFAALRALEALRTNEAVGALVARLPQEAGRMEILFTEALWRLTGKPFGKRTASWTTWWEAEGKTFQPIAESELGAMQTEADERRLRQVSTVTQFFGIKIESQRVIFIIDVSGSMVELLRTKYVGEQGAARIDIAKRELEKAVEGLDPSALFNIISFSSGVERWRNEGIATASTASRAEGLDYVRKLGAAGGTNIYGALEMAFEDPDVDTIVMLSDGEPSVGDVIDPGLIRAAVAEWNRHRGVVVHTVALGSSLQMMEWLAADSGGRHVEFN